MFVSCFFKLGGWPQDRKQRLKAEKRARANDPEGAEEEEPFELETKERQKTEAHQLGYGESSVLLLL